MGAGYVNYWRKVKIIFWGTPDYSVHILKDLIESEHEILAVVTQPDRKRSRGSLNIPSPVKTIAIENILAKFNVFIKKRVGNQ